jgi:hypothetical protein
MVPIRGYDRIGIRFLERTCERLGPVLKSARWEKEIGCGKDGSTSGSCRCQQCQHDTASQ